MLSRSRNRHHEKKGIAEINVVPLLDVALMILIIFIITAPMLQTGIEVDLPRAKARTMDVYEEKLILTINRQQEIFIDREKTNLRGLREAMERVFSRRIDRDVYLRADQSLPYGFVVQVMAEIRKAGVERLGMITDLPEAGK